MKVLLLSDTFSEHTEKWALGLADKGVEVGLFSFNKASYEWYNHPNITVFFEPEEKINAEKTLTKISYLKYVSILKKIIRHFQPDILHAHYATSYGLVGALSKFHPFIVSVWGSDVYDFPTRSAFHKRVLQYNLKRADLLLSTSHVMKEELKKYTTKDIRVTPFGVDVDNFSPRHTPAKDVIRVGTIKPIREKYGIITIIEAAEILVKKGAQNFRFMLIGPGHLDHYKKIIAEKQLGKYFEVPGRIPFGEISNYHNMLDIFLNVSINDSESFGVAVVEAMSCETPVIVTDVGGLMEVVNHGEFGVIVKKENPEELAAAIERLAADPGLRASMGRRARQHVLANYNFADNIQEMIGEYEDLLQRHV